MSRISIAVAALALLVSGAVASPAVATPARDTESHPSMSGAIQGAAAEENESAGPSTSAPPLDLNGLQERTVALLFNRDADGAVNRSHPVIRRLPLNETNRTLALAHDRALKTPPATARTWTTAAFDDYDAVEFETDNSQYPQHANLTTRGAVGDAHLTLFQLQPSTIVHASGDSSARYISETGVIAGMIDYRERIPEPEVEEVDGGNIDRRVTTFEVQSSRIENVTVTVNGEAVPDTQQSATHLPRFVYDTTEYDTVDQIGLKAEIVVTVRETTKTYYEDESTPASTTTTVNTTRVTVADNRTVTVYDLRPDDIAGYRVANKTGDERLAIRGQQPWSALHIVGQNTSLSTRWRFTTARTPGWTRITVANESDTATRPAPDLPVTVHAIPTTNPPDAEATRFGVAGRVTTTAPEYPARSPPQTVPETVNVSAMNSSYHPHDTIAARYPGLTPPYDATVVGFVNGTNATVASSSFTTRSLRPAEVVLETRRQNETHTVVFVQVRDDRTKSPIQLSGSPPSTPLFDGLFQAGQSPDRGQVVLRGKRVRRVVRPGANGTTVALETHGAVRAGFEPASWTVHDPAYKPARATTYARGAATTGGVLPFVAALAAVIIPFLFAVKLARTAGRIIHPEDHLK